MGNLRHLCDADNQTPYQPTRWTCSARNQKLTEAFPGHSGNLGDPTYDLVSFQYSPIGRLTLKTDQQGDTCQHTYDLAGRLLTRQYTGHPNGPLAGQSDTDTFTYSPASRILTAHTSRYNNTITFTHAPAGRRLTESLTVDFGTPQTYTVGSTYDSAGRRTQITYPDGTAVNRTYTERDQLAQIDYTGNMVATYAYDSSGRRTTRTLGDTPNTQTQWQYTRADNLTTAIQSDIPGASFTYTYDANKNKLTETISAPMTAYGFSTTSYDPSDRLTSWSRADANLNQSWSLSLAGDWNQFTENTTTQTRTHTGVHELATLDTTPLVHDAKGNLTTNQNTHTYTWDFDNRLASATVGPNTHSYTYDALGRRVSKTIADGANVETTVFVYSGQQVLTEYLGNVIATTPDRKFFYATYIDDPILLIDRTALGSAGAGIDEKFYYHQNNLYSSAALTDQSGSVQERYSYSAYGHVTFHDTNGMPLSPQPTASPLANPYLYTGRRLDGESGLHYYRARYHDPVLGRFLSRDPLGYEGDDVNFYRYVSDRPLSALDPRGLKLHDCPLNNTTKGKWSHLTMLIPKGGCAGGTGGALVETIRCYKKRSVTATYTCPKECECKIKPPKSFTRSKTYTEVAYTDISVTLEAWFCADFKAPAPIMIIPGIPISYPVEVANVFSDKNDKRFAVEECEAKLSNQVTGHILNKEAPNETCDDGIADAGGGFAHPLLMFLFLLAVGIRYLRARSFA